MAITSDMLHSLISITQFNRGQAAKIFDRLRTERQLVVLKNNQPSAIILSPEEYARLSEIEEDYTLLTEANDRLVNNIGRASLDYTTVLNNLGFTEQEVNDAEDVEIE